MFEFLNAVPEEVGIPSAAILKVLDRMEIQGIEAHSLSVVRHDRVCAEGYWYPYTPEIRQLMYSSTKSVTAVAIGFAVQEGLIRMDETLEEIFDTGEWIHETLRKVTIEHLLTMSCGQETEINVYQPDWIKEFLNHPATHEPGSFFFYNTAGVDLLVAILKRRSGLNLMEYLRPRLLDPLGISSDVFCGTLPDGTEIGGGALFWRTEDYKRFTRFMLYKGCWNGQQLLDREWMDKACGPCIRASEDSNYGYLIWMDKECKTYSSRGMLGQFGICIPEKDAFIVVTSQASTVGEAPNFSEEILRIMNEDLIPAMGDGPLEVTEDTEELKRRLSRLKLNALPVGYAPMEKRIDKAEYIPDQLVTSGNLMEYFFGDGSPSFFVPIESVRFDFDRPQLCISLKLKDQIHQVMVGLGGKFAIGELFGETVAACGRWRSAQTLELEVRLLERLMGSRFLIHFDLNAVTMHIREDSMELNNFKKEANASAQWSFHR